MHSNQRLAIILSHFNIPVSSETCVLTNKTSGSKLGVKEMAMELVMARVSKSPVYNADAFAIPDIETSYAILNAMICQPCALGPCIGWKCGMTDVPTYTKLGLKEPMRAPLFQSSITNAPGIVSLPSYLKNEPNTIEAEFGFKLNRDFKPINGEYSMQEVTAGISEVMVAIEVCGLRFGTGSSLNITQKIADGGVNIAVVFGTPRKDISKIVHALKNTEVTLELEGKVCSSGTGKNVLGNPLASLTWLVNNLNRSGLTLKRGSSIITGAVCKCKGRKGDTITARFSGLEDISVTLN